VSNGHGGGARELRLRQVREALLVTPGKKANLAKRGTSWTDGEEFENLSGKKLNSAAKRVLAKGIAQLKDAQELLYASDTYALLVVLQAMDAAGKDSTIEHVMSGVNPQGVDVVSFKTPSTEELDHTFLWRIAKNAPAKGMIGIFNRSHYEEVVTLKVHPDWLEKQHLPAGARGKSFWAGRYDDINAFERHLDRSGTRVVKFFLHVSKEEQKKRFIARLDDPAKNWKFSAADVAERAHWDHYMKAYDDAITATSTEWAPWYVIPADNKHVMQAMVVSVIVETIHSLQLKWPVVSDAARRANAEARELLDAESE
jgi:PPK2 family polyphosphate:nucleotide phosphotransferase